MVLLIAFCLIRWGQVLCFQQHQLLPGDRFLSGQAVGLAGDGLLKQVAHAPGIAKADVVLAFLRQDLCQLVPGLGSSW